MVYVLRKGAPCPSDLVGIQEQASTIERKGQEMNAKHTPGPWRIEGQSICGNDINGFICTWSGYAADARLIAAAPELIEALERILNYDNISLPVENIARAAIRKARGE